MSESNDRWNVRAETRNGEIQYAWGFSKEEAKEVAKEQRARGVFKSVRIERDQRLSA